MKKIYYILILFLILGQYSFSQGIHFSQWYEAPVIINPANAGSFFGDYRANLNYRNQWATLGNSYKTMYASYDMPLGKNNDDHKTTGIGASFYSDKAGKSNYGRTEALLSLSQSVSVSRNIDFSLGLGFLYGQVSANFDNLKWDNQYDGTNYNESIPSGENILNTKSSYFDLNTGFLAQFFGDKKNQTSVGFSASNIVRATKSTLSSGGNTNNRSIRIIFHGKSEISIMAYRGDLIVPTWFLSAQGASRVIAFGGTYKLNLGMQSNYTGYYNSSFLEFGGIYRHEDALVAIVKFDWEQKVQIGASYDINISRLRNASVYQGGFEVSLVWKGTLSWNQ